MHVVHAGQGNKTPACPSKTRRAAARRSCPTGCWRWPSPCTCTSAQTRASPTTCPRASGVSGARAGARTDWHVAADATWLCCAGGTRVRAWTWQPLATAVYGDARLRLLTVRCAPIEPTPARPAIYPCRSPRARRGAGRQRDHVPGDHEGQPVGARPHRDCQDPLAQARACRGKVSGFAPLAGAALAIPAGRRRGRPRLAAAEAAGARVLGPRGSAWRVRPAWLVSSCVAAGGS